MDSIPMRRQEWGQLEARLEERTPFGVTVEMDPQVAQVREPLHLSWVIVPEESDLPDGTDLLTIVPRTWKLDLNGAFPELSKFFAVWEGGYGNGRQCLVKVDAPIEGVEATCELIPAGFEFLIHVHLKGKAIPQGEGLRVHLAHPDGTRVRAPQTVQLHPFVTAIRPGGTEAFRPISTVPGVKTYGGPTRFLRVTAQAVVEAGDPATFKVVPMDQYELNRGTDYGGDITVVEAHPEASEQTLRISQSETFARVRVPLTGDGPFHYVQATDLSNDLVGRSNPIGHPESFGGYRVFYGDLHVHCNPCDGYGTMREAYDYAYEITELDFASVSHQQNSSNFPLTDKHWQEYLQITESYNGREGFATLPICENYSHSGHRHSLFRSLEDAATYPVGPDYWVDQFADESRPERLWETLADREALTFPHHLKFIHGTDWDVPPNPMEPVMEICSRWGSSECGGNHSAQYALSQGRRLGFVGGTDNHLGQPGAGTHGYNEGQGWVAVLAPELTREAVYDAIKARRCYATSGAKILLSVALGDQLMGAEIAGWSGSRTLRITAAGARPIDRLEVIRNGEVVYEERPMSFTVDTAFEDTQPLEFKDAAFPSLSPFCYYYVRVTQRDRRQAGSSPIWLSP